VALHHPVTCALSATLSSPPLVLSFPLHFARHHRHLHSFPTRRSSDLTSKASASTSICAWWAKPWPTIAAKRTSTPKRSRSNCPRSEEHTSELQSRFDLVCRLLLEKKNKHNTKHHRQQA